MADSGDERLELYKLAVEMADRVSARRALANSFFVTVNGALVALVGVAGSARKPTAEASPHTFDSYGLVITAIAGVILSVTWWLKGAFIQIMPLTWDSFLPPVMERLPWLTI